jgi:hypothetical protein
MLSFASVHAEGSKEFKKLKLALHQSNSMEDYEDLEDWVFAGGLSEDEQGSRFNGALGVFGDRSWDLNYEGEEGLWSRSSMDRLEKERGEYWWAGLVASKLQDKYPTRGIMVNGEFHRNVGWGSGDCHRRTRRPFHRGPDPRHVSGLHHGAE